MSRVPKRLDRYLDIVGDGSGNTDVTGDYSSVEEIFYIQPPKSTFFILERMLIFIQDTGAFDADSYGNGISLANGIVVRVQDDSDTLLNLTAGKPIKTNAQWTRLCYDVSLSNYGTGDESAGVRWTFSKAGHPLRLDGSKNERLEVVLNDSFVDLVDHTFLVQGYIT